ncbi:single-stranded DNA-binding protein [Arsenicicoccus dermatophilus]|uniref:single-stranded DNA-binding protein n=1 Tax=Arsenicicoccus dermatophilus TaxID=1076331 RepID=UPI001F4C6FD9|nr:single-stranded DNA-binding protein [Arsenicicoccus dermatophilus]MCH8612470.1 single-stranded DNA-binding protein [Arsenicicoccus dermatophilus]
MVDELEADDHDVDEGAVGGEPSDAGPAGAGPAEEIPDLNEVRLRGRVAADPVTRELPSGDRLVSLRLVVRRARSTQAAQSVEPAAPPGRRAPTVDAIDVGCWPGETAQRAGSLVPGEVVEVTGTLHRRFWRSPGGPASRYEVRASSLDVVRGTPAEPGGPARPTVQA